MKSKLLESLNRELGREVSIRRYNLADMISESYGLMYRCEKESNLRKLAESHLEDVKTNPRDTERLSRQLGILKELVSLTESGELKDEDLVDKEHHDTVEPNEERVLQESKEEYTWGDWQIERGNPRRVKYYTAGEDILNKIIGVLYAPDASDFKYSAEIYNNETATTIGEVANFDSEEKAVRWIESRFTHQETYVEETPVEQEVAAEPESAPKKEMHECDEPKTEEVKECDEPKKEIKESEDPEDLTDEELEELAKHLETIRKNRKEDPKKEEMTEAEEPASPKRRGIRCSMSERKNCNESKSYKGLSNFRKQSESKAFYKTFKKMESSLKEGKELSQQETINLYKASNSALTHLSVELEHNPDFLEIFKESVSLLSVDVNAILKSLSEGNSPSESTLKSLSKFSEALLYEAEEEEEELPPIEDEEDAVMDPEDFVGDDEGEIEHEPSEEEEKFDQEYADGREELHQELVDEFGESEDEFVQDKIEADRQEVAEITGEDPEEIEGEEDGEEIPAEEETPVDPEEDEVVDDITDDELAELKKHLKEMRAARKSE